MGDNSTISCCEVLNNLIFPGHEQHHNNSFLIASVIMGQSNMAAGATMGSNHNSRANDGELVAGRGFWPGLCSSVKHSSRFAPFTLLAKGDFPAELDITLPFALVNNNVAADRLEIMPAYWWLYNMYALARNTRKYHARDKRITKIQNIEFDTFAPDTMQEVIKARRLLELWTAKAYLKAINTTGTDNSDGTLIEMGRKLLRGERKNVESLNIVGEGMENSRREVRILKAYDAYHAYGDMLIHYAMSNIMNNEACKEQWKDIRNFKATTTDTEQQWINLGGQLVMECDIDALRRDIRNGTLDSWEAIHNRYNELWKRYPTDKLRHALNALCAVLDTDRMSDEQWKLALAHEERIQRYIGEQVFLSRKKDHDNPFRSSTCRNSEEALAIFGKADDNGFVKQMREECAANIKKIEQLKACL